MSLFNPVPSEKEGNLKSFRFMATRFNGFTFELPKYWCTLWCTEMKYSQKKQSLTIVIKDNQASLSEW